MKISGMARSFLCLTASRSQGAVKSRKVQALGTAANEAKHNPGNSDAGKGSKYTRSTHFGV